MGGPPPDRPRLEDDRTLSLEQGTKRVSVRPAFALPRIDGFSPGRPPAAGPDLRRDAPPLGPEELHLFLPPHPFGPPRVTSGSWTRTAPEWEPNGSTVKSGAHRASAGGAPAGTALSIILTLYQCVR